MEEAVIRLEALSLRAGAFEVRDVSLEVADGETLVLLGPNGSGKSLLVGCLCGLVRATGGRFRIDGRDVTDLEPRLRGIGFVPQDSGLFPHLDVARNVTFGLRARGLSGRAALCEAAAAVATLHLDGLLGRSPATLSGGERQRVALARALAIRPKLLLLDEPVSALDGPTRAEVLDELRRVREEFRVTTIHVCHAIDEAMAVADRAGVMIGGRLVQTGRLDDLLRFPADPEVARLLHAARTGRASSPEPGASDASDATAR
jgi:molybdate transport system ATP-binding protein